MTGWPAEGLDAWSLLPPPLPRTVRPFPNEQLSCYVQRLARANALDGDQLEKQLKTDRRRRSPLRADLVIALSGQPATSMRYALLELCTPQQLATMNVVGRPRPGHTLGVKCERCLQARGIHDQHITCWRRGEDVICHRHRRWIGTRQQLDLTGHEEILKANKRHLRLISRHGRRTVLDAFTEASSIFDAWVYRHHHCGYVNEHLERFHGPNWDLRYDAPTLAAAQYPPIVALTRLLASPHWRRLATRDHASALFAEFPKTVLGEEIRRTVAPSYRWEWAHWDFQDKLAYAFIHGPSPEKIAHLRLLFNATEPPIDSLESGEMPHDR
ncbi:hypothetical protein ACIBF1_30440 [Spirillospora sp. NPDC050679]